MGLWQRIRPRKRWQRLTLYGGVGFVVFSVASVELTSQSFFCNSCHIMGPYYQSWTQGKHKDVECVKCHISPGVDSFLAAKFNGLGQVVDDVLNRTSTKPSAAVSQLACTRPGCHSIEKVRNTSKTEGTFKFRHDKHLDLEYSGIKLACGTCHSHVKGNEHFEVNKEMCINCHLVESERRAASGGPSTGEAAAPGGASGGMLRMAVRVGHTVVAPDALSQPAPAAPHGSAGKGGLVPPNACTACHDPPKGIIERHGLKVDHAEYLSYGAACESCHRSATATPEPIADGRCLACHTFGVENTRPAAELRHIHAAGRHKIECFSCHGTMQHGPAAQTAAMEQFDCRKCHQDQHSVQRDEYLAASAHRAADGTLAVSPMFLVHVDCTGCHVSKRAVSVKPDSGATVAAAVPEACDACHKPGLGAQMVPLWQKTTRALYDRVAEELKAATGADPRAVEEARRLMELVRLDGSWGVHNPKYTQQLLEQARAKIAPAKAKDGGS
ncbi:MAG: NapC/NirT family cytochrome c [Phycisphaerae bacterium]|nr:NapC/NirT family cytochrome c [Phycisphaerae bacterium]